MGSLFLRSFTQTRGILYIIMSLGGAFTMIGGKAADRSILAVLGLAGLVAGLCGAFIAAHREMRGILKKVPEALKRRFREEATMTVRTQVELVGRRTREGLSAWKTEMEKERRIALSRTRKESGPGMEGERATRVLRQISRVEEELRG
jgi:hypothetical protein